MECTTCIEPYNKTVRKRIDCIYCSFHACLSCWERYTLSEVQEPHCMNCKRIWRREFIDNQFPKQFVNNELKVHREEILFEQQIQLLAQTQSNVKLLQEQRQIESLIEERVNQITELQNSIAELEYKKNSIDPYALNKNYHNDLMIHCSYPDCRGFIENNKKCGICSRTICLLCREIETDDHICDPQTVETVKTLEMETKRCPNCAVRIFKVSGCHQMWCTNCRTAFDWESGERIREVIHNPHYFEYLENNGGRVDEIFECGDGVMFVSIEDIIQTLREVNNETFVIHQIIEVYRYMIHYNQVVLPKYPTRFDQDVNLDLRMKYLITDISEEEFKKMLQRRQKDMEKRNEYRYIGDAYVQLLNDVFRIFIENKNVDELVQHIRSITKNAQEAITQLNKRYTASLPLIRSFI